MEVEITVTDLLAGQPITALMLVVSDTAYNCKVPILIGTNVIRQFAKLSIPRFRQKTLVSSPWQVAFSCLQESERQDKKLHGKLGTVRVSLSQSMRIEANQTVTIQGRMKLPSNHVNTQLGMLVHSPHSMLPSSIELTPGLITVARHNIGKVPITLSNLSDYSVVIVPNEIMCEVHQVNVAVVRLTRYTGVC